MPKGTLRVRVIGDSSGLNRTLRKAEGSVRGFGGKLAAVGVRAAAAGAAITAAVGVASVKAFGDFDAALNQSVAIMGNVSSAMRDDMASAAREVAKSTTISAKDAAEGFFFLASAGLDAKASIAALPQVAKFAQAGMFDMALATDLATDAQSALGLAVKNPTKNLNNLTRVTDVLVKANTLANASVQQFSEALTNKAGAALKVTGKSIEEGVAVLAAFADQGLKGAAAGEALNIVLRDVTRAAEANSEKWKALGIDVFDAEGNLKNMSAVIAELEGGLGGLSDAQLAATLDNLGLTRAVGSNIKLLLGSSDAVKNYEKQLRKAGGATSEVADKQLETFNAQVQLLKNRLTDVAITIGGKVAPVLLRAFDRVSEWWSKNGPAIVATAKDVWNKVVEFARPIVERARRLFDLVRDNFDSIRDKASEVWSQVAAVVGLAFEAIKSAVEAALEFVRAIWENFGDRIVNLVSALWTNVTRIIKGAFQVVKGIFDVFLAILKGDWSRAWEGVKSIVRGVWNAIIGIVKGAWAVVSNVVIAGARMVRGVWSRIWNSIGSAFAAVWEGMKSVARGAANFIIGNVVNPIIDAINVVIRNLNRISPFSDVSEVQKLSLIGEDREPGTAFGGEARPRGFQHGGRVHGTGPDTIPALLRPGEVVLRPEQARGLREGGGRDRGRDREDDARLARAVAAAVRSELAKVRIELDGKAVAKFVDRSLGTATLAQNRAG